MNKISKIPDDFLVEKSLSDEQIELLIAQINRFYELREKNIELDKVKVDDRGLIFLNEGTIIHGISSFKVGVLENIQKIGIITGQALGIPEDGETFYCADFHRVDRDMAMDEFNREFTYIDGRCPFGNGRRGAMTLAFVIDPIKEGEELLSYDCYRDTTNGIITRGFTNERGLLDNSNKLSSILYGVPSNLINGIVLGNRLLENKDVLNLIIKLFPKCYISSIDGVIIYNPEIDMKYSEVVELRASKYVLNFQKKLMEEELARSKNETNKIKKLYDDFIEQVIQNCPEEEVARLLMENKIYQGTMEQVLEYVKSVKNNCDERKKSTKL